MGLLFPLQTVLLNFNYFSSLSRSPSLLHGGLLRSHYFYANAAVKDPNSKKINCGGNRLSDLRKLLCNWFAKSWSELWQAKLQKQLIWNQFGLLTS